MKYNYSELNLGFWMDFSTILASTIPSPVGFYNHLDLSENRVYQYIRVKLSFNMENKGFRGTLLSDKPISCTTRVCFVGRDVHGFWYHLWLFDLCITVIYYGFLTTKNGIYCDM